MNRILFEKGEIADGVATFGGERAEHVMKILHGEVGQTLKTGEINGLIGTSVITNISCLPSSVSSPLITVSCSHTEKSISPWIDLILAPPRPRVMKRLLPQLAAMGVGRIFLVGAKKVEKDFWGATLLRPENYRPLLIDGLMQAGTSMLPTLETRRNFRKFIKEELDTLFGDVPRIVAHPYGAEKDIVSGLKSNVLSSLPSKDIVSGLKSNVLSSLPSNVSRPCLLLAIGPEGGWTDDEVALLEEHGFARYSLGSRILRTDTATIALLAQLMKEFDQC